MAFNTVDTSGFDEAVQGFEKALEAYKNARSILASQTQTLTSHWEGEGGNQFRKSSSQMLRLLDNDEESLVFIIDNLIGIKASYADWDTEMASKLEGSGQS